MAMATQAVLSCSSSGSSLEFHGLRPSRTSLSKPFSALAIPAVRSKRGRGALGAQCGFIGSPTNLIIVTCTTLSLVAGRFGLAPSANRVALPGLKLVDRNSGLQTGDPAGFTGTDVLAFGVFGHIIGVAIVLGLKNLGSIP